MLVIHPKDKSTSLAEAIYANMPNVHVVEDEWYERGIGQLLWQTPKEEPILIIGMVIAMDCIESVLMMCLKSVRVIWMILSGYNVWQTVRLELHRSC